jgi:putative porin
MWNSIRPTLAMLACCVAGGSLRAQGTSSLRFNGDFRVRYEYTSEGNGSPALGREVVRFRLGLTYPLREDITVRVRVATGDPGDPNSTDVTLSSFVDDVAFTLDVASVEINRPRWAAFAGKFVNPLQYTELVWDGDVNPQGVAARGVLGDNSSVTATVTGLYFIVDQQANNRSSDMGGGQVTVSSPAGSRWRVSGSAGYYDYRIRSLTAANSGDTRSNRLAPGGTAYLSDFNLLDLLFAVDYSGIGGRYPLRVVGDYVHNSGADDLNSGWGAEVFVGRAAAKGDLRYRYGYGVTDADAVLAAFSHDNTSLGTNYEIHTLSLDLVPLGGLFLNATLYHYRPHVAVAGRKHQNRLRLNAMVTF